MGIWVVYAKAGTPNLPKVIVVSQPTRAVDPNTKINGIASQGLKVPTSGGVTYPVSKENADLAKQDPRLVVKYLEHLDETADAKIVNAAVGKDLEAETKGKMSKPIVESDAQGQPEPDAPSAKHGRRG